MLYGICHVRPHLSLACFQKSISSRPFFFFFSALFKKDFSKNFLLFFVRIIVLDIVIRGLVEGEVAVVIAIRILVTDSPSLSYLACYVRPSSRNTNLRCQKKHSFVEATDHWYFRLGWILPSFNLVCIAFHILNR